MVNPQPSQLRLAFFIQDLKGGGAERMMVNLANALVETENVKVDFVLVRNIGVYISLISPKIRVIPLNTRKVAFSIPALVRYIDRTSPDAMLSTLVHCNIAALIAKKLSRTKTLFLIREANRLQLNQKNLRFLLIRLSYRLIKFIYPWADAVFAVSKGVATELQDKIPAISNKLIVMNNPVITSLLYNLSTIEVNHPWLLDNTTPVILGVGRLNKQKNFPLLINAFSRVVSTLSARLIILGEGPERTALEELIVSLNLNEKVALPGFNENPYAYMSRASVFVLSSDWEGSPNVLVEAMALGTPVIATDCPSGPAEILENGKFGFLVPVDNVALLADAIIQSITCTKGNSNTLVRTHVYEASRVAKEFTEIIKNLQSGTTY